MGRVFVRRSALPTLIVAACIVSVCLVTTLAFAQGDDVPDEEGFLTTLGELVWEGGVLMIPIAVCSVLTLGLGIERIWALRPAQILPPGLWPEIEEDLKNGALDTARAKLAGAETPLTRMLSAGLVEWRSPKADFTAAIEEAGLREADHLQKHLPGLQGIASVAPLLGLLGTVVGMIKSFYTIAKERAVGNPELFAEPIGQALVTTAAGLSVAIPALVLFYFFRGRIRRLTHELDDVAREALILHKEGR